MLINRQEYNELIHKLELLENPIFLSTIAYDNTKGKLKEIDRTQLKEYKDKLDKLITFKCKSELCGVSPDFKIYLWANRDNHGEIIDNELKIELTQYSSGTLRIPSNISFVTITALNYLTLANNLVIDLRKIDIKDSNINIITPSLNWYLLAQIIIEACGLNNGQVQHKILLNQSTFKRIEYKLLIELKKEFDRYYKSNSESYTLRAKISVCTNILFVHMDQLGLHFEDGITSGRKGILSRLTELDNCRKNYYAAEKELIIRKDVKKLMERYVKLIRYEIDKLSKYDTI
jgi:hypothetical protein